MKVPAGPESRVMSLAPVSPPNPVSPHRPVFYVTGIMMASVYCNELSNPVSEARNFVDRSGGAIA